MTPATPPCIRQHVLMVSQTRLSERGKPKVLSASKARRQPYSACSSSACATRTVGLFKEGRGSVQSNTVLLSRSSSHVAPTGS